MFLSFYQGLTVLQIAVHIKEIYNAGGCYLSIKLDRMSIDALQLGVDAHAVRAAILKQKKLKLKVEVW